MPRRSATVKRWLYWSIVIALAGAVVALLLETRRLAELAGTFERDAWLLRRAVDTVGPAGEPAGRSASELGAAGPGGLAGAAPDGVADGAADGAVGLSDYARLRLELHETQERLRAVTDLLAERNAELERRAQQAEQWAERERQPMPEGVRQCLEGLHACLRSEGFEQQRFLRAAALDEHGLHDVELLDVADDGLGAVFVRAGRMTATIDRERGQLELRFFDGDRTGGGQRQEFAADGWPLVFRDVDGRAIEQRLPFLVQGTGSYPTPALPGDPAPATDVDAGTRRQWLARLERVLGGAGTDPTWRMTRFRGLADGYFLNVDLVSTDAHGALLATAHCARMAMEVDAQRGVVSLLMLDGVLRERATESTIRGEGYRMLLPGLTPDRARDAMLGMVVQR